MLGLHPVDHDKSNYIESLRSSMKKCEEIARENLKSAAMGQKRLHDLRFYERSYASGSLVYIMDDAKRVEKVNMLPNMNWRTNVRMFLLMTRSKMWSRLKKQ